MDTIAPPPTLTFQPRKPAVRRARAPPGALVLVAAAREADPVTGDWLLRLAFDRPVDVSGLAPGQGQMDDLSGAGWVFVATGVASRPDARTVVLALAPTDVPAEQDARFTATAANGL